MKYFPHSIEMTERKLKALIDICLQDTETKIHFCMKTTREMGLQLKSHIEEPKVDWLSITKEKVGNFQLTFPFSTGINRKSIENNSKSC